MINLLFSLNNMHIALTSYYKEALYSYFFFLTNTNTIHTFTNIFHIFIQIPFIQSLKLSPLPIIVKCQEITD